VASTRRSGTFPTGHPSHLKSIKANHPPKAPSQSLDRDSRTRASVRTRTRTRIHRPPPPSPPPPPPPPTTTTQQYQPCLSFGGPLAPGPYIPALPDCASWDQHHRPLWFWSLGSNIIIILGSPQSPNNPKEISISPPNISRPSLAPQGSDLRTTPKRIATQFYLVLLLLTFSWVITYVLYIFSAAPPSFNICLLSQIISDQSIRPHQPSPVFSILTGHPSIKSKAFRRTHLHWILRLCLELHRHKVYCLAQKALEREIHD
jgi:hypothetical protein